MIFSSSLLSSVSLRVANAKNLLAQAYEKYYNSLNFMSKEDTETFSVAKRNAQVFVSLAIVAFEDDNDRIGYDLLDNLSEMIDNIHFKMEENNECEIAGLLDKALSEVTTIKNMIIDEQNGVSE